MRDIICISFVVSFSCSSRLIHLANFKRALITNVHRITTKEIIASFFAINIAWGKFQERCMCFLTLETRIPSDMHSPTWETHIPSDMCFPTWERHIPSHMCSPTWETRIPNDMCSPTWETHIPSGMCSPT